MSKKRRTISIPESIDRQFQEYAHNTNRTLGEFLIEAGQQMIRRYNQKRVASIEQRLSNIRQELDEVYGCVHRRDNSGE